MGRATDLKRSNGLVAVLLITRSRPGPKLVFHYPARPASEVSRSREEGNDDSDSEVDSGGDEAETSVHGKQDGGKHAYPSDLKDAERTAAGLNKMSLSADSLSDDEHALGYSFDTLEKLLSPGRWSDRKKFEICLDGLTFVGHPIYANHDGNWSSPDSGQRRGEDERDERAATPTQQRKQDYMDDDELAATGTANITITSPQTPAAATRDFTHIPESFDSQTGMISLGTSRTSTSTTSGVVVEQIQMFHVVFAFASQHQEKASEVYRNVAKKLTKALHYCQKQSGYVATESRKLLATRTKAKQEKTGMNELWMQMVESSELAWALKQVYERISAGDVAGIRLNGMEISLQVPKPNTSMDSTEGDLSPHTGLLLLESKDTLLRELSHPDASPLAYFIREHTPAKTLQWHSTKLNLPLKDILYLAGHLIKWRKARAISRLHPRNMYTTHPEARAERIEQLMPVYARLFPALPPLPQMLKVLSGRPIQYGMLIPSRDHRQPFMDLLAFLVRHQLVTQLKTYGWLKVYHDEHRDGKNGQAGGRRKHSSSGTSAPSHLHLSEDDDVSVSSHQTAIPILPETQINTRPPQDSDRPATLVLDPSHPSDEEAMVLDQLRDDLLDSELRERFSQLLPYFDGEHALEDIGAKEGIKRKKVEEWLGAMRAQGHLLAFGSI